MKLMQHQEEGVQNILSKKGCYGLFWDVGTGKTLTALKSFEFYHGVDDKIQMIVVCPISLIESSWKDDIEKFTNFNYSNLRNKQYDLDADILLVNYELLISAKFKPILRNILARDTERMIVVDESQRMKSYNSKTTKYLLALARHCSHRLVMTATPAPTETDYWSQITFINPTIFGDNFFRFRNRFFQLVRGKVRIPVGSINMMHALSHGYKIELNPSMKDDFYSKIKTVSQFIKKEDVLDLPEAVDVYRKVEMTTEQKKAYKEMWDELVTELNEEQISVNMALAKICKVRQICNGFMYSSEGIAIPFNTNPKLNELKEVIDEIGQKQIIVFCQYKWEINEICTILGSRAVKLNSEVSEKDEAIERFRNLQNAVLVTHPLSAGVGLSFNSCAYEIFYSLNYSFLEYYQCKGRIMRPGKQTKATYIHLLAKDSIDEVIYEAVQKKYDLQKLYQRILR